MTRAKRLGSCWPGKSNSSKQREQSIQDAGGAVMVDPREINNTFKSLYEKLYASEYPPETDTQASFLERLEFPNISNESKDILNGELTVEEISNAIDSMRVERASVSDGLPIDIYKRLKNKLHSPAGDVFGILQKWSPTPFFKKELCSDHSAPRTRKAAYQM
jgi:hypothetical protein